MENKIKVITELSLDDNKLITSFKKTYEKRYNIKVKKYQIMNMAFKEGIKILIEKESLLNNEINNFYGKAN